MPRAPIALALALLTACSTAHVVPLSELRKLDGYDAALEGGAQGGRALQAQDGAPLIFNSSTPLELRARDGRTGGGEVLKLRLDDANLRGDLVGGERVEVKLDELARAEVRTRSSTKTGLLIAALIIGALLAPPLIWGIGCAANSRCGQ